MVLWCTEISGDQLVQLILNVCSMTELLIKIYGLLVLQTWLPAIFISGVDWKMPSIPSLLSFKRSALASCTRPCAHAGTSALTQRTWAGHHWLYWRRCWNCPPSLSIHCWHLFIQFHITHCSSPLLMLLISSRILRFSSSRVRGIVLQHFSIHPRDRNLRGLCQENDQAINPY